MTERYTVTCRKCGEVLDVEEGSPFLEGCKMAQEEGYPPPGIDSGYCPYCVGRKKLRKREKKIERDHLLILLEDELPGLMHHEWFVGIYSGFSCAFCKGKLTRGIDSWIRHKEDCLGVKFEKYFDANNPSN